MSELLQHPLMTAMGFALLHSLWVFGLLIAAGHLTSRIWGEPSRRHTVLLTVLIALVPIFLSLVYLGLPTDTVQLTQTGGETGYAEPVNVTPITAASDDSRFRDYLPALAAFYIVGLLCAAARTAWAYRRTLGLRRGTLLPEPEWRDRYRTLRRSMLPGSQVTWQLSAKVDQVLTVGVWRPLILFPLGMLNRLSPEEVEAILRHELAHLRRRDHLWQALQQLVITLFFYHPLVYWLGRQLDREREFACDDLAAGSTGRTTYARALLRVAAHSLHPKIPFTVSATDRSTFSYRVRRLFSDDRAAAGRGSYLFAPLLSLPLFLLFLLAAPGLPSEPGFRSVITGTVVDAATGDPLIGTSVLVKGSKTGTITDLDGTFSLNWDEPGAMTLLVSYTGYVSKELIFDNGMDRNLDIQLSKQPSSQPMKMSDDPAISLSNLPQNVLLVIDGRIVDRTKVTVSPADIANVKVIKDKDQMEKLGYDVAKDGVLIITTKDQ